MGRTSAKNGGILMRAVVQRVNSASVKIKDNIISKIEKGFLILIGVCDEDNEDDIKYLADKIINLRVFEDSDGKMNLSLRDVFGELLIVSQFTLFGDCRKGRRPSFDKAGSPKKAEILYNNFIDYCKTYNFTVKTGEFGADMKVTLENDGPVTLLLDSKKLF